MISISGEDAAQRAVSTNTYEVIRGRAHSTPKVSIVILNWNGKNYLKSCLTSLYKLSYKPIEIIVVDNGSTDGSQEFVRKNYRNVILIQNSTNLGFAGGNNTGFKKAVGKYILFLNNDTVVTVSFLEPLVQALENDTQASCIEPQMRISKHKKLLDEIGAFLTPTGFLYHYGFHKPHNRPQYNITQSIFSAKGACMLIRKATLDSVGAFDEDFFIFFEETDLCFRFWLSGHKVLYVPESIIYHEVGGDTSKSDIYSRARRIYLTFQNMNCSYIKNFGTRNLLTIYPTFIVVQIFLILFFSITGQSRLSGAILSAWWWNFRHIGKTLKKRYSIQSHRVYDDSHINRHILAYPKLSYYYWLLVDAKKYEDVNLHVSV